MEIKDRENNKGELSFIFPTFSLPLLSHWFHSARSVYSMLFALLRKNQLHREIENAEKTSLYVFIDSDMTSCLFNIQYMAAIPTRERGCRNG